MANKKQEQKEHLDRMLSDNLQETLERIALDIHI